MNRFRRFCWKRRLKESHRKRRKIQWEKRNKINKTLLLDAVRSVLCQDDLTVVSELMKTTKVDTACAELASRKGVGLVVEKYLNSRSNPNKRIRRLVFGEKIWTSLLENAVVNGYFDIVKMVLQKGGKPSLRFQDKYDRTCIERALIDENDDLVDLFVKEGNWKDRLTAAVYKGEEEKVEQLLCNRPKYTSPDDFCQRTLDMMFRRGIFCLLKYVVENGHSDDGFLNTRLNKAASYGQIEMSSYLKEKGAQMNKSYALHAASRYNHPECVRMLVKLGAVVDKEDQNGFTPIEYAVEANSIDAVKVLLENGANVNQTDTRNRKTLLMNAAHLGLCDMIQLLLDNGADANIRSDELYREYENDVTKASLDYAIEANYPDAALLLLPHTDLSNAEMMGNTMYNVGNLSDVKFVSSLLRKVFEEPQLDLFEWLDCILSSSVERAHFDILQHVLLQYGEDQLILDNYLLVMAIKTDNPKIVKLLLSFIKKKEIPSQYTYETAMSRNNKEIIKIIHSIFPSNHFHGDEEKEPVEPKKVDSSVSPDTIFSAIPKSVEWDYSDKLEGIECLLNSDGEISIDDLVVKFHAPAVHLELCHDDCRQPIVCQLVREALVIQKDLLKKIGMQFPIFRNADAWPVGSILERTRIGKIPDELDTNVSLDKELADKFHFNDIQKIVFKDEEFAESSLMERYTSGSHSLKAEQLFEDFLFSLWTQLCQNDYKIPDNCSLSKNYLHINRTFIQCNEPDCVDTTLEPPVFRRCVHDKKNSPTLTHGKMGPVLHFVWKDVLKDQEGKLKDFYLDVDFICPMIPTKDVPKDVMHKVDYLFEAKPVGWLDELAKITDTSGVETEELEDYFRPYTYLCRLKMISPGIVTTSNSEPFMREESLTGVRKKVYLALKILKEITGAKITSYRLKASILKVFRRQPDKMNIGEAAEKVLNHYTKFSGRVGDLFYGVSENMKMKGFIMVDLTYLGDSMIKLIKEDSDCVNYLLMACQLACKALLTHAFFIFSFLLFQDLTSSNH